MDWLTTHQEDMPNTEISLPVLLQGIDANLAIGGNIGVKDLCEEVPLGRCTGEVLSKGQLDSEHSPCIRGARCGKHGSCKRWQKWLEWLNGLSKGVKMSVRLWLVIIKIMMKRSKNTHRRDKEDVREQMRGRSLGMMRQFVNERTKLMFCNAIRLKLKYLKRHI